MKPEPIGERDLGRLGFERLHLLDPEVRLLLGRLACEGLAANFGEEVGERPRPLAWGCRGGLVGLAGQSDHELAQVEVPRLPGASDVIQA